MVPAPVNLIASALAKGLHDVVRKTWGGIESISGGKCTIRSGAYTRVEMRHDISGL